MRTELLKVCEDMIRSREALNKVMMWEDDRVQTICAAMYAQAERTADQSRIEYCKKQIKERVGLFSEIRGLAFTIIACRTDIRGGEERYFDQLVEAYKALREEFWSSPMLALGAEMTAENCDSMEYSEVAQRAKVIYKNIQSDHPFLTGEDDYLMCILLAQIGKDADRLSEEVESCYRYLKENGMKAWGNALQSASCVLSLYEGEVSEKCGELIELQKTLKSRGCKYENYYGLSVLAVLSQLDRSADEIVTEMKEVHDWLKDKKGFGFFTGESNRMMYAAMLVSQSYSHSTNAETSVAGGVLAAMIAEQMALIACVTASIVSAASSSGNN